MPRKALTAIATIVVIATVATGSVSAQTGGLLEPGAEVPLPGGGGVQLPGGGGGGNVDLPGDIDGDGTDLPNLDTDGDGSNDVGEVLPDPDPEPSPEPAPPAPAPTPTDPGAGDTGTDPAGDGVAGGGGPGGRGDGRSGNRDGDRDRDRDRNRNQSEGGVQSVLSPPLREPDGTPTAANPGLTIADYGPTPLGVPNFVIDQFTIPPFLLPIYQACGTQYGVPWQVLASINRIETAFGTNLNVSSAGALGWMQFIPSSWEAYGVDANNDGRKDPYNPVDAICAAANYLDAAGYSEDARGAIFAYNHADWYVDEVVLYANQYSRLPDDLIGSLTGLTEGARFPVAADARYADDISERRALERSKGGRTAPGNAAEIISSSPTRRGINIYTKEDAPVVAVNDGVITDIGKSKKLGRYMILRDAYGNRFTYAQLGSVQEAYPVPKEGKDEGADRVEDEPQAQSRGDEGEATGAPSAPASPAGEESDGEAPSEVDAEGEAPSDDPEPSRGANGGGGAGDEASAGAPQNTEDSRPRIAALPDREGAPSGQPLTGSLDPTEGMLEDLGYESFEAYFGVREFDPEKMELRPLEEGSRVVAGTVLGRVGEAGEVAPHLHFAIRPAGRGAPTIDPKPILDGWKLLEATHIYRAAGKNPFEDTAATSGQVLLLSKEQAQRQLLAEPRVSIYECGRTDVATGQIDVRVMRMLLYLAQSGFRLTVTSLKCGHSVYTSSGSISHHSTGNAVDIAQINGLPVLGNQGAGSITEALVRQLLELQGTMVPAQIISLMEMGGPTFAMGDHADHVHVGYTPAAGATPAETGRQLTRVLGPDQWERLIARLGEIENPTVPTEPSRYSLPVKGKGKGDRASPAHAGE